MYKLKDIHHQTIGPFSAEEIRVMIAEGKANGMTLAEAAGSDFWQPLERFPEFGESLKNGPKTPAPSPRSNAAVAASDTPTGPTPSSTPSGEDPHSSESKTKPEPVEAEPTDPHQPATASPESTSKNEPGQPPPQEKEPESKQRTGQPRRYLMIGADGREYGPATEETVREWIRQRRANGSTRMRLESATIWGQVRDFSEFADLLGSSHKSGNPPPSGSPASDSDQAAREIIDRGYNIDVFDCVRRAWKLYQGNFWGMTVTTAIVLVILNGLHALAGVGTIAGVVLSGPLVGGLFLYLLRLIRKQPVEIGDVFAGFKDPLLPLLLGGVVISVLVSAGLIFCILPGVYLWVAWTFATPLIMDRRIDFWPAMELSRKVVHERWWEIFGLTVIYCALLFVGLLAFVIGIFLTAPIAAAAIAFAYEDIYNQPSLMHTGDEGSTANKTEAKPSSSGPTSDSGEGNNLA